MDDILKNIKTRVAGRSIKVPKLVYQRKNGKWEARYRKGRSADGKILYGTVYGNTEAEAVARRIEVLGYDPEAKNYPSEMNLLIIGAGVHGNDCKDIAESLRIFKKIRFLDDNVENDEVIGRTDEIERFRNIFSCGFVAIGDNETRKRFAAELKKHNYLIPSLISPFANISTRAVIGDGVVIFPQSTVKDAVIGDFCILDNNTLVNNGVELGEYTRIDCGGIVLKGMQTPVGTWIKSGEIFGKGEDL